MWLNKLRLKNRIGLMAFLGLGLFFVFMIWQGMKAMDTVTRVTLQERLNLARTIAGHIDHELERIFDRLSQVASFPTINLEDRDMEAEKAELRKLFRPLIFKYVFILNRDGEVLWTEPYLFEVVGRKWLECPEVQKCLRTGEPGIACITHALIPKSPVIAPIVPIRNKKGIITGLLGGAIDTTSPTFAKALHLHDISPGRTGYIQIVDEKGTVLAHTESRDLFQQSEHADLFISLLQKKKADIATHLVTEKDKGTFREIIAFASLSFAPWGVAVEQEEAELLAPAMALRQKSILFAIAVGIGALFLVGLITYSIVKPVRNLMEASSRIASGDLSTPIPLLDKDEIGKLGEAFDEMRRRLANWSEELETKVKERTEVLKLSQRFLEIANQSTEIKPLLKEFLSEIKGFMGCAAVGIRLLDEAGNIPYEDYEGFSQEFYEKESPLSIKSDRCMCINVIKGTTDPKLPHFTKGGSFYMNATSHFLAKTPEEERERTRNECNRAGFESVALIPIPIGVHILGLIHVADPRENMVPLEIVETMERTTMQLGEAIQRIRMGEEIKRRAQEISILYNIARTAGQVLGLEKILKEAVEATMRGLQIDAGGIFLLEPDGKTLTFTVHSGVSGEFAEAVRHIQLGEGISGRAAAEGKAVVLDVPDYPTERLAPYIIKEGFQTLASTPIISEGKLLGAMNLGTRRPRAFPPSDLELLESIGYELGQVVERAQLYEETQWRVHELEARQRVIEAILQTLDLDKRLSTALFEIMKLIEAEMGGIYLVERDRLILRIHQGLPDDLLASLRDLPLAKTTWARETTVVREHLSERGGQMDEIFKAAALQSWVAIPLKVEDRLIGTFFLSSRRYEAFSADDVRALSALAELVAVAVENARLYTETQQRLARLTTLREIDRAIAAQLSLKDIMDVVLKRVPLHIVGVDAVGFSLIDWEKKHTSVALLHLQGGALIEDEAFRLSESLMGDLVKHRQPVLIYDLQTDPRIQNYREIIRQYGLKSYLGVPLVVQDQAIGLLHVLTTQPRYFRDEEVDFFATMAGQSAIALRNAQFFEEIKTSEERYRSLFDRMPLGLYRTTPEGKFMDVNPALVQILGYPDQESLLGINVAETYVDPKDRVQWQSRVDREGIVRNYEMQLRRRDGTIIWVEENARVIHSPEGHVLCYEGGLQDITERKQSEEEYKTILRTAMDGFWIVDMQGRFLDVNDAYCRLIGYSRDEMLTMRIPDVEAVERPEETAQRIEKIKEDGGDRFETRHRCRDGRIIDIEVSVNYMEVGGGRMFVFLRDITERKRAEEALRESEEKYRNLVESISDIVYTIDSSGVLTYISPVVKNTLGYEPDELIGRQFLEFVHKEDHDLLMRTFSELREGIVRHSDYRVIGKHGDIKWVRTLTNPIIEEGGFVGARGVLIDITERKQAEEALRRAEENFRRSLDESPLGVRIVSANGETLYANRAILEIYGYDSIEELRTTPVKKRYTQESYAEFQIRREKRQQGEYDPPEYEISIVRKNGEVRHLQVFRKEVLWNGEKQYQAIYLDITERKWAEEALQASKELFEKTFISQRDAIFLLDAIIPPTILDCNPAATEVFGYTREEMVGRTMNFLHVDEIALKEFLEHLYSTISERSFLHQFEFQMRRKDGTVFPTEHSVSPLEDIQSKRIGWVSVVQDVTESKRARDELIEREMFNFALFQYNPIQTIVVDLGGKVIKSNLATKKSGDRLPNVGDVMYKDYARRHEINMYEELMKCIRSGNIREFPELKYDDKVLSITISPFPKGAVIISQDITERKRTEERVLTYQEQLRSLTSELSLIEERERRRIATELHDNISQTLAITKIKLGMAQGLTSSTDWVGSLNEIGQLIDQAIQYTRSLTFELSPPILYELGLEAGIEWLTEQIQEKHGIQIGFEDDRQPKPMSEEIRITLFKATRELLINIVKHAQASKAKVSIWREDISIRIRVEDDGVGFSTSEGKALGKTTGFGLFNIGERIKYLGGDMVIESEPGRGTRVTLSAPLEEKEDNK